MNDDRPALPAERLTARVLARSAPRRAAQLSAPLSARASPPSSPRFGLEHVAAKSGKKRGYRRKRCRKLFGSCTPGGKRVCALVGAGNPECVPA